jgi:hypothetical protein
MKQNNPRKNTVAVTSISKNQSGPKAVAAVTTNIKVNA